MKDEQLTIAPQKLPTDIMLQIASLLDDETLASFARTSKTLRKYILASDILPADYRAKLIDAYLHHLDSETLSERIHSIKPPELKAVSHRFIPTLIALNSYLTSTLTEHDKIILNLASILSEKAPSTTFLAYFFALPWVARYILLDRTVISLHIPMTSLEFYDDNRLTWRLAQLLTNYSLTFDQIQKLLTYLDRTIRIPDYDHTVICITIATYISKLNDKAQQKIIMTRLVNYFYAYNSEWTEENASALHDIRQRIGLDSPQAITHDMMRQFRRGRKHKDTENLNPKTIDLTESSNASPEHKINALASPTKSEMNEWTISKYLSVLKVATMRAKMTAINALGKLAARDELDTTTRETIVAELLTQFEDTRRIIKITSAQHLSQIAMRHRLESTSLNQLIEASVTLLITSTADDQSDINNILVQIATQGKQSTHTLKQTIGALTPLLDDSSIAVQCTALSTIGQICARTHFENSSCAQLVEKLLSLFTSTSDKNLQRALIHTTTQIIIRHNPATEILEKVIAVSLALLSNATDCNVQAVALECLTHIIMRFGLDPNLHNQIIDASLPLIARYDAYVANTAMISLVSMVRKIGNNDKTTQIIEQLIPLVWRQEHTAIKAIISILISTNAIQFKNMITLSRMIPHSQLSSFLLVCATRFTLLHHIFYNETLAILNQTDGEYHSFIEKVKQNFKKKNNAYSLPPSIQNKDAESVLTLLNNDTISPLNKMDALIKYLYDEKRALTNHDTLLSRLNPLQFFKRHSHLYITAKMTLANHTFIRKPS